MSFATLFAKPATASPAAPVKSSSGFAGLFADDSPEQIAQAQKVQQLESQQQVAAVNAQNANSVSGLVKNTLTDLGTRLIDIPIDFAKNLWQTYQQTPQKLVEDVKAGAADMQQGNTVDEQATAFFKGAAKTGVRTAGDAAIAIFAPISAAIGSVLTATGGQQLIDDSGRVIANASGITDVPAFQKFAMEHPNAGEDFNRLLTLFMSGAEKGKIDPVRITKDATDYAHSLIADAHSTAEGAKAVVKAGPTRSVPVAGESVETPVSISTPASRYADYRASQGYEPYVPNDQLPTIQVGKAAKDTSGLPSIQIGTGRGRIVPSDYTYEPVEPVQLKSQQAAEGAPVHRIAFENIFPTAKTEALPVRKPGIPKIIEGTGNAAENTRAVRLEKAAIERKLTNGLGDLPTHNRIDMGEQADLALDYAHKNPEHALDIALGRSAAPDHILPESIYTALEAKAIREGDTATIEQLVKSRIPTAAGQALKALDSADPDSPVNIIKALNKSYEEAATRRGVKNPVKAVEATVAEAKKAIKESVSKRQTWEDFIEEVQCKY